MTISGRMARRLLVPVTLVFLVLLVLGSLVPTDSTQTDTSTTPLPPPDALRTLREWLTATGFADTCTERILASAGRG